MSEIDFKNEQILKYAEFFGLGFYRVNYNGQFVECDKTARNIFGIPQDEKDLSKHSIRDLYIVQGERDLRMRKFMKNKSQPLRGSITLRIKGENRHLFDICRYDESYQDKGNYVCLVSELEDTTIFPKMFDTFPLGLYELDNKNRVARVNKKLVEILKYNILGRPIKEIYEDEKELDEFNKEIIENGVANKILRLKDVNNKIIEVECFSQDINNYESPRWGMVTNVTRRKHNYRTLHRMPAGFFQVEKEHITQCNDHFARILGFEKKEDAIGKDPRKYFVDKKVMEQYFQDLKKAADKGEAVHGYTFDIKTEDGRIITISVDSHLVKNSNGKIIGREGTIRDITEQVKLQKRVKETEERLRRTTADINNLIHTFLHPVLKFSGHSELLRQLGNILYKSIRHKMPGETDIRESGEQLENKLIEIKKKLKDISEISGNASVLNPIFEKIINVFDYNLDQAQTSKKLLDKEIRDTALWVLEELEQIGFFEENIKRGKLDDIISSEFVEYLQNILFGYLIRITRILRGETQMMRREVEALRRYIGLGERRVYHFKWHNLEKILAENIEIFKPVLLQKDIEVEYISTGNLYAMISEVDIDRVICNLLHNASKYSYKGPGRFVKIRAKELESKNAVEFNISSLGIPIKKREIENGEIFKFGYRSALAYIADRDGTGVGLADAKDVINEHHGEITITSNPAGKEVDPPEYKVPYITTVTVKLPKTRKKKENKNENE